MHDFLTDPDDDKITKKPSVECPELIFELEGVEFKALIDKGSKITCLSASFYEENKDFSANCATFPVIGLQATGFTGERSVKLKKKFRAQLKIGNISASINFLIVPKLLKACILGIDSQTILGCNIFVREKRITFDVNNVQQSFNYEVCRVSLEDKTIINQVNFEGGAEVFTQHENFHSPSGSKQKNINLTDEEIDSKLVQIDMINEDQRSRLRSLLCDFREIFRKTPGRFRSYKHTLILKNPEPFFFKSYDVPFKYREAFSK